MPRRVPFCHIQAEKVEQLRISFSLPFEEGEENPVVLCQFTSRLPFFLERRPSLRLVPFRFLRGGATEQNRVFRGQPSFGKKEWLDDNKFSSIISLEISCRDLIVSVDRKSTRLNSSHTVISYAVFCLKKKKEK